MARLFTAANSDKIDCGTPTFSLGTTNGLMTISAFVRPASTANMGIFSKWNNASSPLHESYWFGITGSPNRISIFVGRNGGATLLGGATGTTTLSTGTWYHLMATWQANAGSTSQVAVFINGVRDALSNLTKNDLVDEAGQHVLIGASNDGTAYMNGDIAEVAVWNAVLYDGQSGADRERAYLAAGGRPWRVRPGNLKGYWPLFGMQSPEPDLSGAQNSGTLTGTAASLHPPMQPFAPRQVTAPTLPDLVAPLGKYRYSHIPDVY